MRSIQWCGFSTGKRSFAVWRVVEAIFGDGNFSGDGEELHSDGGDLI